MNYVDLFSFHCKRRHSPRFWQWLCIAPLTLLLGGCPLFDKNDEEVEPEATASFELVAVAGSDQTVAAGSVVTLDGSQSHDNDNAITAYHWQQLDNVAISLSDANAAVTTFTAVSPQVDLSAEFKLTVTNDAGETAYDFVSVTILAVDEALLVDAGEDQVVDENTQVTLSGNASDDDDEITTITWSQVGGPTVEIANANTLSADFLAPSVDATSLLEFELRVSNEDGLEVSDRIAVTVNNTDDNALAFFAAQNTGSSLYYLWRTDGSSEGTVQISTKVSLLNDRFTNPILMLNDVAYFKGYDMENGFELWRSDGSDAGTWMIPSAAIEDYESGQSASAQPILHGVLDGLLIYSAIVREDEYNYYALLSYDPLNNSLTTLFDGLPSNPQSSEYRTGFFQDRFYFSVVDYSAGVTSLYSTDGHSPAELIDDLDSYKPHIFIGEFDNQLYFWEQDAGGFVLGHYNGENIAYTGGYEKNVLAGGTGDSPWPIAAKLGEQWVFVGPAYSEVMSVGQDHGNPSVLEDLDNNITHHAGAEHFFNTGDKVVFFSQYGGDTSDGLWVSKGNDIISKRMVALRILNNVDWYEGQADGKPMQLSNGKVFFVAQREDSGSELWVTDGSESGTHLVKDLLIGSGSSNPALLRPLGENQLMFIAGDGPDACSALWKTDGSVAGTQLIKRLDHEFCYRHSAFYPPAA